MYFNKLFMFETKKVSYYKHVLYLNLLQCNIVFCHKYVFYSKLHADFHVVSWYTDLFI